MVYAQSRAAAQSAMDARAARRHAHPRGHRVSRPIAGWRSVGTDGGALRVVVVVLRGRESPANRGATRHQPGVAAADRALRRPGQSRLSANANVGRRRGDAYTVVYGQG